MENEYKMILFGDAGSGQSSIIQMSHDSNTAPNSIFGMQLRFHQVNIKGQSINIHKFEEADGCRFIQSHILRIMHLAIILYDVTNPDGLASVQKWLNYIEQICSHDLLIIVVANKIDKIEERVITQNQGIQFSQSHGLPYYEISANDKISVDCMFKSALQILIHKNNKQQMQQNPQLISENIKLQQKSRKQQLLVKINFIILCSLLSLVTYIFVSTNFTQAISQFNFEDHYILNTVCVIIFTIFSLIFIFQTGLTLLRK